MFSLETNIMSKTEFKMPKMGESITEGTIINWLVQEGESFSEGDILVEVATVCSVCCGFAGEEGGSGGFIG